MPSQPQLRLASSRGAPVPWFLVACVAKGLTASRGERRTATAKPAAGGSEAHKQLKIDTPSM
jgi:hypothetical protein